MRIGWAAALALCAVLPAAKFSAELAILDRDRDPARLEAAAIRIASSGDAEAVAGLAKRLGDRSCLRRLDPQDSGQSVVRLGRVFEALAQHPSPAVESLCLTLARDAEFTAVPARLNFLLNALAAVRPMSQPAADVFRTTGRTGYLEVNGPLLSGNASPRALEVLGELLADRSLDTARRVSMAHWALLPARTDPEVVATCARVLAQQGLSREVHAAILESLFDYQPRMWFGVRTEQPRPPSWQSAPPRTRELLESLAAAALARPNLDPPIRQAIENTLRELR
jgi:hypothetical protein